MANKHSMREDIVNNWEKILEILEVGPSSCFTITVGHNHDLSFSETYQITIMFGVNVHMKIKTHTLTGANYIATFISSVFEMSCYNEWSEVPIPVTERVKKDVSRYLKEKALKENQKCWRKKGCLFNSNHGTDYMRCWQKNYSVAQCEAEHNKSNQNNGGQHMNQKELDEIIKITDRLDWSVTKNDEGFEFEKFSPAGQDFSLHVSAKSRDDLVQALLERYHCYDPSEEAYLWLDNTGHGKNGAPYDMLDVYEDMMACREMIQELIDALSSKEVKEEQPSDDMKRYIILYADEYEDYVWEQYCRSLKVPKEATEVRVYFNEVISNIDIIED